MGREARLTAALTSDERLLRAGTKQRRLLAALGRSITGVDVLYGRLCQVHPAQREELLTALEPYLSFEISEAERRWLFARLDKDVEMAAQIAAIDAAFRASPESAPLRDETSGLGEATPCPDVEPRPSS